MNNNLLKNKKWYVVLFIVSCVGIFITVVFRLINPKNVVIPENEFIKTNRDGNKSHFNNIKFSGDIPALKTSLPLVRIQPSNTNIEYLKKRFIENHNLKPVENIEGLWKGENYTLSYNRQDDEYLFYSNFLPKDAVLTSRDKAITVAQNYVNEVFSQIPFTIQPDKIKKFSGLQEMEEVKTGLIAAMEIPFTYNVDGVPLLVEHREKFPLTILINSEYQVQKIVFQPNFFYPLPTEQQFKILSLGEVLENINNKQYASIISAYESNTGVFSLEEIVAGDLTSVQLEYRADLKNNLAYPFYHFSGEVINQDNQKIQAEIIAPAVKVAE